MFYTLCYFLLILDSIFFVFFFVSVDLYIVGTANAGKSSLFNALLASDYCKSSARDLIERATVSVWPGDLEFVKLPYSLYNLHAPVITMWPHKGQRFKRCRASLNTPTSSMV